MNIFEYKGKDFEAGVDINYLKEKYLDSLVRAAWRGRRQE
jgi:hypothetical protein